MATDPRPQLILFDFDGTLCRRDSMFAFLWYAVGLRRLAAAAWGAAFKAVTSGKTSRSSIKEDLTARLFAGKTRTGLHVLSRRFAEEKLPALLRVELVEKLVAYKRQGDRVAVVSASLDVWLQPFCEAHGIQLICTQAEYRDDVYTGRFATPDCKYDEKVRRVRAIFSEKDFKKIIAYGNSSGDYAMLEMADEGWLIRNGEMQPYQNFRPGRPARPWAGRPPSDPAP